MCYILISVKCNLKIIIGAPEVAISMTVIYAPNKHSDCIIINLLCLKIFSEEDDTGNLMKTQFEAYILSLPNCVNRDLIDKV